MGTEGESLDLDCLGNSEIEEARTLKARYLDESPNGTWDAMRREYPDLFVAYRRQGKIIAICYGWPAHKERCEHGTICLQGIAVAEEFAGKGFGSHLLHFFESQVRRRGGHTVTLGSAGGYVDHFYMKNGYQPVAFMICIPAARTFPPQLRKIHGVASERIDGNLQRLYVNVTSLDNSLRDKLKADFNATEVVAIMNKRLAAPLTP